ncbi:hypothetical protein, partial [Psychroserpens sp.]|uniref:hypothetical protein n=1 Tax=Psychroserpens sp. TaxID=2020870 RepID=UPI00385F599E
STLTFSQDGVLDTSFGTNGIEKTDINDMSDVFSAIAVQDDGKIIVVGHTSLGSTANKESIILRYNANGGLDTSFGNNGVIIAAYTTSYDTLNDVKIQDDGKIVVGGFEGLDFVLARYTANGQLDTTFGTNGVVFTDFFQNIVGSTQDRINALAIQSDGKILAAGYAHRTGNYHYAIARYNTDGSLDSSFGVGGKVVTNNLSGYKEIYDIAITSDDKFYVVGETAPFGSASYNNQTIVKFNSDGTIDTSFAINGVRYFDLNNNSKFEAIQIQDDGKLVIVGNRSAAMTIVRLTDNASYDNTFSGDGRSSPALGAAASFGKSIWIQPDGKIIVSGNMNDAVNTDAQSAIIRYLTNGELDTTFSDTGILKFLIGDGYQGGSFSAFQPNGKLIVGGDFNDSTSNSPDLYLYRLTTGVLSTDDFEKSSATVNVAPNPVKNILNLNLDLNNSNNLISAVLYNINGQKISILIENETLNSGRHNLSFDLSKLNFDQGFIVVQIGDYTKTIKILN